MDTRTQSSALSTLSTDFFHPETEIVGDLKELTNKIKIDRDGSKFTLFARVSNDYTYRMKELNDLIKNHPNFSFLTKEKQNAWSARVVQLIWELKDIIKKGVNPANLNRLNSVLEISKIETKYTISSYVNNKEGTQQDSPLFKEIQALPADYFELHLNDEPSAEISLNSSNAQLERKIKPESDKSTTADSHASSSSSSDSDKASELPNPLTSTGSTQSEKNRYIAPWMHITPPSGPVPAKIGLLAKSGKGMVTIMDRQLYYSIMPSTEMLQNFWNLLNPSQDTASNARPISSDIKNLFILSLASFSDMNPDTNAHVFTLAEAEKNHWETFQFPYSEDFFKNKNNLPFYIIECVKLIEEKIAEGKTVIVHGDLTGCPTALLNRRKKENFAALVMLIHQMIYNKDVIVNSFTQKIEDSSDQSEFSEDYLSKSMSKSTSANTYGGKDSNDLLDQAIIYFSKLFSESGAGMKLDSLPENMKNSGRSAEKLFLNAPSFPNDCLPQLNEWTQTVAYRDLMTFICSQTSSTIKHAAEEFLTYFKTNFFQAAERFPDSFYTFDECTKVGSKVQSVELEKKRKEIPPAINNFFAVVFTSSHRIKGWEVFDNLAISLSNYVKYKSFILTFSKEDLLNIQKNSLVLSEYMSVSVFETAIQADANFSSHEMKCIAVYMKRMPKIELISNFFRAMSLYYKLYVFNTNSAERINQELQKVGYPFGVMLSHLHLKKDTVEQLRLRCEEFYITCLSLSSLLEDNKYLVKARHDFLKMLMQAVNTHPNFSLLDKCVEQFISAKIKIEEKVAKDKNENFNPDIPKIHRQVYLELIKQFKQLELEAALATVSNSANNSSSATAAFSLPPISSLVECLYKRLVMIAVLPQQSFLGAAPFSIVNDVNADPVPEYNSNRYQDANNGPAGSTEKSSNPPSRVSSITESFSPNKSNSRSPATDTPNKKEKSGKESVEVESSEPNVVSNLEPSLVNNIDSDSSAQNKSLPSTPNKKEKSREDSVEVASPLSIPFEIRSVQERITELEKTKNAKSSLKVDGVNYQDPSSLGKTSSNSDNQYGTPPTSVSVKITPETANSITLTFTPAATAASTPTTTVTATATSTATSTTTTVPNTASSSAPSTSKTVPIHLLDVEIKPRKHSDKAGFKIVPRETNNLILMQEEIREINRYFFNLCNRQELKQCVEKIVDLLLFKNEVSSTSSVSRNGTFASSVEPRVSKVDREETLKQVAYLNTVLTCTDSNLPKLTVTQNLSVDGKNQEQPRGKTMRQ